MRPICSAILAVFLLVTSAQAGTQVLLIYDPIGPVLLRIVIPDNDAELDDPAYAPPGTKQLRISIATFKGSSPKQLQALIETAK